MNELEKEMINRFEKYIFGKGVSNDSLIQFIEISGLYLGLKTISQKAKELNTDYNNVKMSSIQKVKLFNVKFVIDN